MMFVRLVHLTDFTERKELMIIGSEELPPGVTADALKKGGAAYALCPVMEKDLISRAVHTIAISQQTPSSGS